MSTPWERFKLAATLGEPDQIPVALIVDSPWLPGYAGVHTLDFFLDHDKWYEIHHDLLERFPDAVWIPGFWVEYGMAAEPSAFGCKVHFHADRPPSMMPLVTDASFWANAPVPNVYEDGFMPLALRWTKRADERLRAEGLGINIVAARGPLVTASWVMGVSDLMTGLIAHPAEIHAFLDTVTETIIRWLHAQLEQVHAPEGIFLLDDIAGMMSLEHYEEFAHPRLRRIFDEFDGLLKIFHNDMPCGHLFERMADANFDVFNFTHLVDIAEAKAKMGHRVAMMGNIPPLSVGVRETPEVVAQYAKACLDKAGPGGGMILSVGGGVSPDMPAANIDAMLAAARDWIPPTPEEHQALLAAAKSGPEKAGQRRRRRRQ